MGTHPIFESDFDCLTDFGLKMSVGETLIRFTSQDFSAVNSQSISVPSNASPNQIKAVFLGLVQEKDAQSENFDFLVGEQLIRTNLDIRLKQNFVETDNEIEILVLKRQDAPVPEHSFSAEDWISDVAALGEKVLVASYDGTVALWDAAEEELLFQIACGREPDKSDPLKTCCWLNDPESENYQFAAGGIDSSLTVYQWSGNRDEKPFPIYSLRGHHGSIETLTTVDKNTLISAGQDRKIKIWKDFSMLGSESDDLSSKKRAKRELRGEVK